MSSIGLTIFVTILPVILILVFVNSKDKTKEPISLLIKLFSLGIISCFLTLGVSFILEKNIPFMNHELRTEKYIYTFLYAFVGVALIEELFKWIMVYFAGYKNKKFDELYDIIIYSVFVSLGFAFIENIIYVLTSGSSELSVAVIRAISAVPGHACDAIFMGYYLCLAKQFYIKKDMKQEKNNMYLSILVPTLLHGIYDFCLMSDQMVLIIIFILFVLFLYYISIKKLNQVSKENAPLVNTMRLCPNCGAKVEKEFCPICGKKIQ